MIQRVQYSAGVDDVTQDMQSLLIDIRYRILHRKHHEQRSTFLRLRRESFGQIPAIVVPFRVDESIASAGFTRSGGWRADFTDNTAMLLYFDQKTRNLIAAFFTAQVPEQE